MRTTAVRNTELFEVAPAVAAVGRGRHISMAGSQQEFRDRARAFLDARYPGCSDGFADHVTNLAWDAFTQSRVRLEISPAAVGLLTAVTEGLPDGPGVSDLRKAAAAAADRLGWTPPAPDTVAPSVDTD